MKRLRFFAVFLIAVWSAWIWPVQTARAASVAFSFQLGSQSVSAGGMVALNVKIGTDTGIAGFRLRVSYDSSVLRFAGTSVPQQIEPDTMQTNSTSDPVCSVYVCNVDRGHAPPLSGTVVTYYFQVLQNAPAGATDVCACVDETCDYSAKDMCLDTYGTLALNVQPSKSGEASLTALQPSEGELEPAFSPDVTSYRLRVGSGVSSITFQADAAAGASVRVSRRSLFAAGIDTPIAITVTSRDRKAQTVYFVTVSRAAKEQVSSSPVADDSPKENSKTHEENLSSRKAAAGRIIPATSKRPREHAITPQKHRINFEAERALAAAKKGRRASLMMDVSPATSASPAQQLESGQTTERMLSAQTAAPLTVVQSQMPSYLVGMLAAGFCILTGILLSIWLEVKKK